MGTNDDLQYRTAIAAEEAALLEQAKRDEDAFVASTRTEVSASGGTANINLRNPGGSGVIANVLAMTVRSQFEGTIDVVDEFSTAPSGGSSGVIDNLLLDTDGGPADVGSVEVRTGVSFTGSGTHVEDILPSGGPGGQIGGEATETNPIVEPGREFVIEATNQSETADDVAFFIVYIEEPFDG